MSQFYTIKDVKKGNEWQNSFGTFQSYSLSLDSMGEPVSLNKAVPVKDEPQTGQQLYGTVELLHSHKGIPYYKFKTEKVPDDQYIGSQTQNPPAGSYVAHSDDKEASIFRSVALKAAVEFANVKELTSSDVFGLADKFLAWLQNDSGAQPMETQGTTAPRVQQEADSVPSTAGPPKRQWDKLGHDEPLPPADDITDLEPGDYRDD